MKINIQSEICRLDAVLLHKPGAEVENMTSRNAQHEYEQLSGVLSKLAKVYEVRSLLVMVLDHASVKTESELVTKLYLYYGKNTCNS